jgi:hypothetical protein
MWKNDGLRGDTRTKPPIFPTAKFHARASRAEFFERVIRNRLDFMGQMKVEIFAVPIHRQRNLIQTAANSASRKACRMRPRIGSFSPHRNARR